MFRHLVFWLFVSVVALSCDDPPAPEAVNALSSRIELAAGEVVLKESDGVRRLVTGAMLPQNAQLGVGEGGRALVRLSTGAAVFLKGNTSVSFTDGGVSLQSGELWADIPDDERAMSRFIAGKVTVTASGAGLDLTSDGEGAVTVYVARGLAVVDGPGGRVEVQSGESAKISGDKPPTVAPVAFWEDWTGGMADRELDTGTGTVGAGSLVGIDPDRPGMPPEPLQINSQTIEIKIRDGIAHTTVDQVFFNPSSAALEGWYWFTAPDGAAVERFAWEVNGQLVDGAMIERKQAAAAYAQALEARVFEPALLEWVDGRNYRARIYPVPANGAKRIMITYRELLPLADGVYRYVYPMSAGGTRIQEFSLRVDLSEDDMKYNVATLSDARVEKDGSAVTMRRSGFTPRTDFMLELRPKSESPPLRVMRFDPGNDEADYVMMRFSPEVDWRALRQVRGDVVVVLDTSAGSDEADRQVRTEVVEAILRALSDTDRFAVMATDLVPRVAFPARGLSPANGKNVSAAMEALADIPTAGATDLGAMFGAALKLVHDAPQPAVVYVGDGNATVGERSADDLSDRLRRSMGDSRARLFTIAVGADADYSLLDRLARKGGGRSFRIDSPEQAVSEALRFAGMLKTPTITDLKIDGGAGLDQVFTTAAGKLSEGDEIVLVARTHHDLPGKIQVTGTLGDQKIDKAYSPTAETGTDQAYLSGIWARMYLDRLMGEGALQNRGNIIALGLRYSMMTPFTSFLVLDSEAAYQLQGIVRPPRYSSLNKTRTKMTAGDAASIPLGLFGCSSNEKSAMDESPAAMQEDVKMAKTDGGSLAPPAPSAAPTGAAAESAPSAPPSGLDAVKKGYPSSPFGSEEIGQGGGGSGHPNPQMMRDASRARRAAPAKEEGEMASTDDKVQGIVDQIATGVSLEKDSRSLFAKRTCSDASTRPLSERRVLWMWRLQSVISADGYLPIFKDAGERCELPRYIDRKVLLDLIEQRVYEPSEVITLLSSFSAYPSMMSYLRRSILRRTLDPAIYASVWTSSTVNWAVVASGIAAMRTPEEKLAEVQRILLANPDDPAGRRLLLSVLVENNRITEALAEATRLKRDGQATPVELMTLCDLLAEAKKEDEARRTCSELVEFAPQDPHTRQTLGDLFLRHGWYDDAYRQYTTLVEMATDAPSALLRLAMAAAGIGKVDEALRIERKIAASDGETGPSDPRRFARMHSVARLSQMIMEARVKGDKSTEEALIRSLKRTGAFSGATELRILVWEDLGVPLSLSAKRNGVLASVAESLKNSDMGIAVLDMGTGGGVGTTVDVSLDLGTYRRLIKFSVITVAFDGKKFSFEQADRSLAPATTTIAI